MPCEAITQHEALTTRRKRACEFLFTLVALLMLGQVPLLPEAGAALSTHVVFDAEMHGVEMLLQVALQAESEVALVALVLALLPRLAHLRVDGRQSPRRVVRRAGSLVMRRGPGWGRGRGGCISVAAVLVRRVENVGHVQFVRDVILAARSHGRCVGCH